MTAAEFVAAGYQEVTRLDLVALVRRAYDLSRPAGMGFLHYTPGPMSRDLAEGLVDLCRSDSRFALDLDYVRGRAVKLVVHRASDDPTRLFAPPEWFDHTADDYEALLAAPAAGGAV